MRNVFDQYSQPENRLTHALGTLLHEEPKALRSFLKMAGASPPKGKRLIVLEQSLPGSDSDSTENEKLGLPDLWIYDVEETWCLLVECKGEGQVTFDQVRRHQRTAERRDFQKIDLLALTVQETTRKLPKGTERLLWSEVYAWAKKLPSTNTVDNSWSERFTQYLEIAERKMADDSYLRNGTLTTFTGIPFGDDMPYSYGEAKRVLRLMTERLRKRADLKRFGMDPKVPGRAAITGRKGEQVWDYLTLRSAAAEKPFTSSPHLTVAMNRTLVGAGVTVPNGVSPAMRKRLTAEGVESFMELLAECTENLCRALPVADGVAVPFLYLEQRHFKSQRSKGTNDGLLELDLRTLIPGKHEGVKCQPQWAEAVFALLVAKRSNMQMGVGANFAYGEATQGVEVLDLLAGAWIALEPLLERLGAGR